MPIPGRGLTGPGGDAIIVAAVVRRVVRRAGVQALQRQWPGTDDGFAVLCRLDGLARLAPPAQPGSPGPARTDLAGVVGRNHRGAG